jgi:predicted aspartyl protease
LRSAYNTSLIPAAPGVEIRLGAPGEALRLGPFWALIDTGADICIVPRPLVAPLNLALDDERYLRPYGGGRRAVTIHTLDLGIGALRLPAVEIVADELESEIILGRNALSKLAMLLDGPRYMLDIPEA